MKTRREQIKIDPEKCTACHRCTIACSMKHHGRVNPDLSSIRILQFQNQGLNVPVICMACENPPCIKVCPMNARSKMANGSVVTNTEICIGCRACVYICPVSCPAENPYTGQTMTCDMCDDDEAGPWCVTACQYEGALTVCENDSLSMDTSRKKADMFRKMYSR